MRTARRSLLATAFVALAGIQPALASSSFNYLPVPVDITPAVTSAWVDVDVSPFVPVGATGVLVLWRHTGGGADSGYGIRKNGSSDAWEAGLELPDGDQGYLMTGLDSNRILEIYTERAEVRTMLVAYTMDGVKFFTNRIDKSIGATGTWTDIDISLDTGADVAIGAIFTFVNSGVASKDFGLRMRGSTDDRFSQIRGGHRTLGLVGLDGAEVAQQKIGQASVELYLIGYVTHGAVFFTNGVDKTVGTTGAYVDVDITPDIGSDVANGALVELHPAVSPTSAALRRNGATEDLYASMWHGFGAVGIDAANLFEHKVQDAGMKLYLIGYSLDHRDVRFFSATARDSQVELEWLDPDGCVRIHLRRDTVPVAGAGSGSAVGASPFDCAAGGPKRLVLDDLLTNDTTYHYGIFVEYPGPVTMPGKGLTSRPFSTSGPVKWAYSTGATSLAPPGLRFSSSAAFVYAVSNDSILHAFRGGDAANSGLWPTDWRGFLMSAPAQSRSPVVGFAVGGSAKGAALLGSQDGNVYAVNAETGAREWARPIATMVQAGVSGNFLAYNPTALDLVLVGTRDSGGPNGLVALDVHTGAPRWSFVNSSVQNGTDLEIGIISSTASVDYDTRRIFFASRVKSGGSANTVWCVDFAANPPRLVWAQSIGEVDGSAVRHGGTVYVGTVGGEVYALDAASGTVNWSRALGDGPVKRLVFPQFGTNNVLLSTNGMLWSLRDNGATSDVNSGWPVTAIPSPSEPLVVPGTTKILVGSTQGRVYQVDANAPANIDVVTLGDGSAAVGPPTMDVLNSVFYVGTEQGVIYGVQFPLP